MDHQELKISLTKLNGVIIDTTNIQPGRSQAISLTLNAELMRLGFTLSQELMATLAGLTCEQAKGIAKRLLTEVKVLLGANVPHRPMYPNFPKQVIEAPVAELYFNALCHYWTFGEWATVTDKLPRKFDFEATKFRQINLISESEFKCVFSTLLNSADSLSDEDKVTVAWFISRYSLSDLPVPAEIPFAENRSVFAGELVRQDLSFEQWVRTTTDVLRVATYLSDGDVSLAENTRFKSLPRRIRKKLVRVLERVINEEDVARHQKKWVRLFHNLHVGELSFKVNKVAFKARNGMNLATFNGKLESYIAAQRLEPALSLFVFTSR